MQPRSEVQVLAAYHALGCAGLHEAAFFLLMRPSRRCNRGNFYVCLDCTTSGIVRLILSYGTLGTL